ncbi:phosphoribosylanthranilate isomerase [Coralloluteibacterium stylophorae]|uniref:N-(5'-phosphoribosyl)anthranilate isomerase n=1 Tax=Coralloluteibacterium stylophorae TaxID=1776034 RepID=A0A8J8AYV9_9GAMM|nr:phosphoribosylanthranilate isomerase [Coralloluteibacterium stylophorae]MBS7457614.1 phosphoribosylanthranilate isomerase [Coralloluteibacterium stylophorae]
MSDIPYRTRIKFCGMTRPGDVRLAGELGVDAVGFVFAKGSPRRLEVPQAHWLKAAMPPVVALVALFMDAEAEHVRYVIEELRPQMLQFHGSEDEAYCRSFGLPYMKAIPMGAGSDPAGMVDRHPAAAAFLFDGHGIGEPGGSGMRFDPARLPGNSRRPAIVAGGIDPDNVYDLIAAAHPWGIDVSSGIESAPGVKDGAKMRRFVEEVRRADCAEGARNED